MRPMSPFKPAASMSRSLSPRTPTEDVLVTSSGAKGKSRAVFVDVLVEGVEAETGFEVPDAARDFLAGLGEVLHASTSRTATESATATPNRRETNAVGLKNTLTELLTTERSYVRRLRTLHTAYAVPLRCSARTKGRNPMGISAYEANTLFSNVEKLLTLNEAFLSDLELAIQRDDSSWADAVLHHISAFEPYNVYVSNYPAAKEVEKRLAQNTTFLRFCENVQYSPTADVGNAGLRDLLAEPFQRIARYPLLLNEMLRQLSPHDDLRPVLLQASARAATIAHNEHDEVARRTEEMLALADSISDFPKTLINGHRRFVTSIDVKEVPSPQGGALHATLFLFTDTLVVAKRPSGDRGRTLAGLERAGSGMSALSPLRGSLRSSGLQYKGSARLFDLTAVEDATGFAMYFDNPPRDVGTRWSERPTRRYFAEALDKRGFLAQLWRAQAQVRIHAGVSTVLMTSFGKLARASDMPLDRDDAHVFFTIFNRSAYASEPDTGHTVLRLNSLAATYEPVSFRPDRLKPNLIVDGTCVGQAIWSFSIRTRGSAATEEARPASDAALAYLVTQRALQAGLADVPPRYALQHVTETPAPTSPSKHRRTYSNASAASSLASSVVSSVFSGLRESDASIAFGREVPARPTSLVSQDDIVIERINATSQKDSLPSRRTASAESMPPVPSDSQTDDVFGPAQPLSPRTRPPLGPRPSPSQRRESSPGMQSAESGHERRNSSGSTESDSKASKRQREDPEAPASPNSTHVRKRATPPQRAPPTGSYSPGVRSPLGLHPPRHANSERETPTSASGLLHELDAAIEDAAARSDSMLNLRTTINTFALPETKPAVAAEVPMPRTAREGSLPRSPGLGRISARFDSPSIPSSKAVQSAFEMFKAEVNDKLDALLGGWEETTRRYQELTEAFKKEQSNFATAIASRDARLGKLQIENKELKAAHSQLNEEVQEIYNAVNGELDRIFEEAKLPTSEASRSLQQELKRKTADEVLLKYRIQQLEARLAANA